MRGAIRRGQKKSTERGLLRRAGWNTSPTEAERTTLLSTTVGWWSNARTSTVLHTAACAVRHYIDLMEHITYMQPVEDYVTRSERVSDTRAHTQFLLPLPLPQSTFGD
jgi:hypothetical protein